MGGWVGVKHEKEKQPTSSKTKLREKYKNTINLPLNLCQERKKGSSKTKGLVSEMAYVI